MDVIFSNYEEKDFDDLREMMICLYEEDPEGEPITETKISKTIDEGRAHPEKLRIEMIKGGGTNIGYAIIIFFWSNEYGGNAVVIDELYIKKEFRNEGIATEFIMSRLDAYENVVSMKVETTPSNDAGERLYKRLGFKRSENTHLLLLKKM